MSEGTEVKISQGIADYAELAGVDDAGHEVGYGVDEGAETKQNRASPQTPGHMRIRWLGW